MSTGEPEQPTWPSAFFASERTLDALAVLSNAPSLTLYCGAGVTRDRTGVGWSDLITEVFKIASRRRIRPAKGLIRQVEAALDFGLPPKQAASILVESMKKEGESENSFLTRFIRKIIYRAFGWQEGLILRNVSMLAIELASLGKAITIVTTNYDTYIEERIVRDIEDFIANDPHPGRPGLRVHMGGLGGTCHCLSEPDEGAKYIDIYYPHGRVAKTGSIRQDIVFSENSYARNSRNTVDLLNNLFSRSEGLLIIGAGLNDDPLVEALTKTKPNNAPHYALLDLPNPQDNTVLDQVEMDSVEMRHMAGEGLRFRGNHLGLEILFPMFHGQVAQFVDELRIASIVSFLDLGSYNDIASYSMRLDSWWRHYG